MLWVINAIKHKANARQGPCGTMTIAPQGPPKMLNYATRPERASVWIDSLVSPAAQDTNRPRDLFKE